MSSPSFTGIPKWFQVPSAISPGFPSNLPTNYYSNGPANFPPGPFERGGICYWVTIEQAEDGSGGALVAYKSLDYGATQPLIRIASGIPNWEANNATACWDGTSRYIYLAWLDPTLTSSTIPLKAGYFDLQTETFTALTDPGIAIGFSGGDINQYYFLPLDNGTQMLVWDGNSSGVIHGKAWDGSSWGATVDFLDSTHTLLGCLPLPGAKVGVFSTDTFGSNPANLLYGLFDGTTYTPKASATIANFILEFWPYVTIYDPVNDVASICIPDNDNEGGDIQNANIYTVSPADGSGGAIAATLIDSDLPDDHGWEIAYIAANRTFTKFYAMFNTGSPGFDPTINFQLWLYESTSLTGPWSAHSLFYDQNVPNSVPPGYSGSTYRPLIYPFFLRILNDERLAVTAAFGDVDEQDSLVAMIQSPNSGCRYFCN